MGYSIHHVQENGLNLVSLRDDKTGTAVGILPQLGALLHSFSIQTPTGTFNIIDNYNSSVQAKNEISKTFKSAKLSPFPCRILEGKYSYNGRAAEFNNKFIDGSTIHGLLYDKPFSVTQEFADESMASVSLLYHYKNDDEAYPYKYKCHIKYSLHAENLLQIQTTVTNESHDTIPIADGWHPYFQLGGSINDWQLFFKADSMLEFNDKLIPTGRLIQYDLFKDPRKIGVSEFDNCFMLQSNNGHPACELFNPENKMKISFFPDNTYPYLQIFTPPHRKSIAIENLSAAPDCFNNNMGLTLLDPGHTKIFTVGYQVS
jgi:aldose 1-epimerase